jgi:WD40 repeat protein
MSTSLDGAERWSWLGLAISPTGDRILVPASGSFDRHSIRVFERDATGWKALADEPAFSAPGLVQVTSRDGSVSNHAIAAVSAAWSADGRYAITGSGNSEDALRIFDVSERHFFGCIGRHYDDPFWIDWSPSGAYIASASSCYDPSIKLWHCQWEDTLWGGRLGPVTQVGERQTVSGWDDPHPHIERLTSTYGFHYQAISPDDGLLAVVASKRGDGESQLLILLRMPELEEAFRREVQGCQGSIKWSPDGGVLCVPSSSETRFFDRSLRPIGAVAGPPGNPVRAAWSSDGRSLALGGDPESSHRRREDSIQSGPFLRLVSWPDQRTIAEGWVEGGIIALTWGSAHHRFIALTSKRHVIEFPQNPLEHPLGARERPTETEA